MGNQDYKKDTVTITLPRRHLKIMRTGMRFWIDAQIKDPVLQDTIHQAMFGERLNIVDFLEKSISESEWPEDINTDGS